MGIERESFVGNPHRQDYIDEDDDLEFFSGDEIDFTAFGLQPGDPDLLLDETYDVVTEDDEDYEPDGYEDFLSDSEYEYGDDETGSEESGVEQAYFSDSEQEMPLPESEESDVQNKVSSTTTSSESKTNGDSKTNDTGGLESNQAAET
ncbi:hypothetical protein PPYR_02973 [Photinus pyralis]|uniref:Uncharacterized protein n=1 Tax=Photinus pyralis TaxID=7054 RepID=A0A1Y1MDA7_PHOPY|nr:uncharacterized protein LOC116161380 [Photinus pyralis]XP_031330573.1 uncharacterized protein LOC116161380 [Photinus pyralis]KAB0791173.1 hypothetical protein PPYR_02973 [Photinus pyralis]